MKSGERKRFKERKKYWMSVIDMKMEGEDNKVAGDKRIKYKEKTK